MLQPSRYRILAIGKVRKKWIQDGLSVYLKRLPGLKMIELSDSTLPKETKSIQAARNNNEELIALAEEGEILSSAAFAKRLEDMSSVRLAFVIGGAKGLAPELKASACWKLSLSTMTFPHELARLLLVEQIYRAHTILQGSPYHRT